MGRREANPLDNVVQLDADNIACFVVSVFRGVLV